MKSGCAQWITNKSMHYQYMNSDWQYQERTARTRSSTTHQGGVAQVVQAALLEDGGASLEPDGGLAEADAVLILQQLGRHHAQGAQQGPAGVDQLQLAVAAEGLLWVACVRVQGEP